MDITACKTTHDLARKLLEAPEAPLRPTGWLYDKDLGYRDRRGREETTKAFSMNNFGDSIPVFSFQ